MQFPETRIRAFQYIAAAPPEAPPIEIAPEVSSLEEHAMELALLDAEQALERGDPPVAAVLLDHTSGRNWHETTCDQTSGDVTDHAEQRAYRAAKSTIRRDASNCTLVTTAALCTSCTSILAETNIGKIIYAAPRPAVYALTGIMRPRNQNMSELLSDGNTDTIVVGGLQVVRSLELFAEYGRQRRHKLAPDVGGFLQAIANGEPINQGRRADDRKLMAA